MKLSFMETCKIFTEKSTFLTLSDVCETIKCNNNPKNHFHIKRSKQSDKLKIYRHHQDFQKSLLRQDDLQPFCKKR